MKFTQIYSLSSISLSSSLLFLLLVLCSSIKFLKVFGCACFPYLKPYNQHKLQYRSTKCVFLGYSESHKGYRCLSPTKRIYIADTVHFNEKEFPFPSIFSITTPAVPPPSSSIPLPILPLPTTQPSLAATQSSSLQSHITISSPAPTLSSHLQSSPITSSAPSSSTPVSSPTSSPSLSSSPQNTHIITPTSSTTSNPSLSPSPQNTHIMVTRAKNGIFKPKTFLASSVLPSTTSEELVMVCPSDCWDSYDALIVTTKDVEGSIPILPTIPASAEEAMVHPGWFAAMTKELDALHLKGTWLLVPPSPSYKLISNKWVFRVKTLVDGSLDKLKARLVARGFQQLAGVDFLETFCPVVKASTIRLLFSLAATHSWSVQQIDVQNAFLNGDLHDTIYMTQPKGFEDPAHPDYVCKL